MKIFLYLVGFIIAFEAGNGIRAQDERDFRTLYKSQKSRDAKNETKVHFVARTPFYQLDITGNGFYEYFYFERKDGKNFVCIRDFNDREILREELPAIGKKPKLFRITQKDISKSVRLWVLYFFEGSTDYVNFNGRGRLYFLTVENGDHLNISMYKGPAFWHEHRDFKKRYEQRAYKVGFYDYNKDGRLEVSVNYHLIHDVFLYLGNGKWESYADRRFIEI